MGAANIVSCYAAEDGGHFRAHRDNTTKGTAHRRFCRLGSTSTAILTAAIELSRIWAGRFKGSARRRRWCSPGRCCNAVSPVTRGRRYAFLAVHLRRGSRKDSRSHANVLEGDASKYQVAEPARQASPCNAADTEGRMGWPSRRRRPGNVVSMRRVQVTGRGYFLLC